MKKIFKILTILTFLIVYTMQTGFCNDVETKQAIKAGTFAKVMVREEFSTLTADIDDKVTFINTSDMYVYETNAIPEGTIFYGTIEDVLEPIEGRDGALKIAIYKMITPDKKIYKINAHIYSENNNYIGGKQTGPIYYRKVPHYIKPFKPILQAAPLNIYEMGKHTVVMSGSELFLMFDDDVVLK